MRWLDAFKEPAIPLITVCAAIAGWLGVSGWWVVPLGLATMVARFDHLIAYWRKVRYGRARALAIVSRLGRSLLDAMGTAGTAYVVGALMRVGFGAIAFPW